MQHAFAAVDVCACGVQQFAEPALQPGQVQRALLLDVERTHQFIVMALRRVVVLVFTFAVLVIAMLMVVRFGDRRERQLVRPGKLDRKSVV